jgi:hypothetical protein
MEGHMKRVLALVLLAGALSGCADLTSQEPTPQELSKADRAKPPASEQSAQAAVVRYFAPKLKSAHYTFSPAANGVAILDDDTSGTTRVSGWFMCGTINAKNSYGDSVDRTFFVHFDPPTGTTVVDGTVEAPDTSIVAGWCQKLYGAQASR